MLTVLIEELTSGELVDVYQDESRTAVSVCSVCAGEKAVFGHPCICGGVGTQSAEVHGLRAELNATKTKLERYNELIYAVGRKYPGESRSETARRYITQAETSSDSGESQSTKEIGKQ